LKVSVPFSNASRTVIIVIGFPPVSGLIAAQ